MSLNDPSVDFHLKMQVDSFRVPFESMRRNFKDVQKLDEKQFKKIEELVNDLKKSKTKDLKLKKLRQLITSMKQFEKRVKPKLEFEDEMAVRIQARIDKLNELKVLKTSRALDKESNLNNVEVKKDRILNWYRDQTNILISDYLLKNSHLIEKNPGLLLMNKLGFDKLLDSDIILVSNQISISIINKDLSKLIDWITDNKSFLKKIRSNLEFEARLQEYIELVKRGETDKSLELIDQYLLQFSKTNGYEIQVASGLLLFPKEALAQPDNLVLSRYSSLLSSKRYEYLSNLFLRIFYRMHGIPEDDPLLVYLSLGISSLKTRSCICTPTEDSEGSSSFESLLNKKLNTEKADVTLNSCPICSQEFNEISSQLPHSHNVRSYLFENPVMLPNGNIYDKEKLRLFSKNLSGIKDDEVKDPITKEVFEVDDLTIMYPT